MVGTLSNWFISAYSDGIAIAFLWGSAANTFFKFTNNWRKERKGICDSKCWKYLQKFRKQDACNSQKENLMPLWAAKLRRKSFLSICLQLHVNLKQILLHYPFWSDSNLGCLTQSGFTGLECQPSSRKMSRRPRPLRKGLFASDMKAKAEKMERKSRMRDQLMTSL